MIFKLFCFHKTYKYFILLIFMTKETFYVTTAIDYASGKPHIGHAYEKVAADVLARWNRNIGKNVFFQTGTDEHGQKISEKAKEAKKTEQEFVDLIVPQFENLCKELNISYDYFFRATNEKHKKMVQEVFQKSFDNGDIYLGEYEGLYCVGCERYYTEDELIDGKICPDHKTEVEKVRDENYFFKLSKYQKQLLDFYEKTDFLAPESKKFETINRVKEGLQDISVSRRKEKLKWGIECPFDREHVIYVWFDALFNYYTGLKINKKEKFWPANVHIIGKDIQWFHNVYWPAFLMSVGLPLPEKVHAHGHVLAGDGHKMSKSLGNVIDPIKFAKKYGVDELRYAFLSLGTYGEDVNFSEELFAEKVNNELNNDLGNLVSRVHAMTNKYFDCVPELDETKRTNEEKRLIDYFGHTFCRKFNELMQNLEYNKAIDLLWGNIRLVNAYVNIVEPWKQDSERNKVILSHLNLIVKHIEFYVRCFIPSKAERIRKQFNYKDKEETIEIMTFEERKLNEKYPVPLIKPFAEGHKLGEKDNLFEKIKLEKKEDKKNKQSEVREGFASLNLKVGKLVKVEKVDNSDKLYRLQVDLGSEKRQILSGLQQIYKQEELENRLVVVIANLKKAKLAGEESNGMVLAVEDPKIGHSDCGLLTTDLNVGTNLELEDGTRADNDSIIKSKKFAKVKLDVKNGKVTWNGKVVKGISSDRGFEGFVC